jgi:hypothetical protein
MMHKGMLWIAVAALTGSLALMTPASAQDSAMQGFTVNAGIFYPSKKSVRNATEDVWFSVDLGYKFQTSEPTESGYYYDLGASVGYKGAGNAYYIPVHLTFTGYLNEQFFYRAGAGWASPRAAMRRSPTLSSWATTSARVRPQLPSPSATRASSAKM